MIRLLALYLSLFLLVFPLSARAQIQSIGIAGDGEFTRITLASDTHLNAEVVMLNTPDGPTIQLVLDHYTIGGAPYFGDPTGGVSAYTLDEKRIVFELDMPMMIVRELDLPPTGTETRYRHILDLSRVSPVRFEQAAKRDARRLASLTAPEPQQAAPEPIPASTQAPETPTAKPRGLMGVIASIERQTHVVVIDPGHGGRDPGALAITGGKESEVVLKAALALKEELQKDRRYLVRLTRETDVYVEHEDRVSMARDWGADLFISLHADASGSPATMGASVYTINSRGEQRIEGTADKYGWHLPIEDGTSEDVSGILEDLIKRETKSNSTIFAEFVIPELGLAGPLLGNTHRQKNLFVLLAPDVPAVLIEIGFLTNREDAKRLQTASGRRKSAQAIKRGIDAYFDRQTLLLASN
ncbi:MAG: N-acetylmuramoyl-L-alanine amidase [Henriciella sp.]